jgi:hypothetical protein
MMRPGRTIVVAAAVAVATLLAGAAPAAAATGSHLPLVTAGILGDIFGTIGHAVLGAFSWTIGLASKFILTTVGALVRMLIPRSWANEGVQIMEWIVAVPNYAGTVTSPTGHTIYGFAGINGLRDLFTWIGVGLLPLTLVYGTTRAMVGERGHVAVPIARVVAIAALLVSYPYWWTEAAALTDTVTHMVLTLPAVVTGLHKLMLYAVDGVALGGWQLVDLALMALVAIELLSLIFLKVVLILLGALLYATGPITIGLVATDSGAAIARAWASAAALLIAVPVVWATLFAVGALLVGDAGTAGPLIAGNSSVGSLLGGVLLAVAGAASLWMCLRVAREAMGLLRMQLGGLLALSHHGSGGSVRSPAPQSTASSSLRRFRGGRAVGWVARHGVIGTAAAGGRAAAGTAGPHASALVGRSRAGAVAVRMAKAGTAGWYASPAGKAAASGAPANTPRQQGGRAQAGAGSDRRPTAQAASSGSASGQSAERATSGSQPSAGQTRPAVQRDAAPSATRPGAPTPRFAEQRPPRPAASPKPAAPTRNFTQPPPPPPPRTGNHRGRGKR